MGTNVSKDNFDGFEGEVLGVGPGVGHGFEIGLGSPRERIERNKKSFKRTTTLYGKDHQGENLDTEELQYNK